MLSRKIWYGNFDRQKWLITACVTMLTILLGCSKSGSMNEDDTDTNSNIRSSDVGTDTTTETDSTTDDEAADDCLVLSFEHLELVDDASEEIGTFYDEPSGVRISSMEEFGGHPLWIRDMTELCADGNWLGTTPVKIEFEQPLQPPLSVAIDVRMSVGPFAQMILQDANGNPLAESKVRMNPHLWPDCIPPRVAAADQLSTQITLVAHADETVHSAVIAYDPVPVGWGYGMHFDNLAIHSANVQGEKTCPWNESGETIDDTPRCEVSPQEDQNVRYLCIDKPQSVDTCIDCDVECLRNNAMQVDLAPNECVTFPDEIVCGPNPNSDTCCFVVYATDRCVD